MYVTWVKKVFPGFLNLYSLIALINGFDSISPTVPPISTIKKSGLFFSIVFCMMFIISLIKSFSLELSILNNSV